jgi:hypothetical protein
MVGTAVVFVWLSSSISQAQWVMAAHAARNRVQRMTQKSDSGGGYDVATVLLEAAPEKVYDKTVELLKTHPDLTITEESKKLGRIQFREGDRVAGMQITGLGEKLTQLMIASSAATATHASATPLVVESVMKVCKEVNVECTVESP